MDNKSTFKKKISMLSHNNDLIIIMGSRINEDHILNFFSDQPSNTSVICMDKECSNVENYYVKDRNKSLLQVVVDFNAIGSWNYINNCLIKMRLSPKKVIIDWSTAKFVNSNFAVNSQYGDIMDIVMKWINIFNCELFSPCSIESLYLLNENEKKPHYYNFFLYSTKVPMNLDIESINIVWINKFTEYLEEYHKDLVLDYMENSCNYPLCRTDKNINTYFKLSKKT